MPLTTLQTVVDEEHPMDDKNPYNSSMSCTIMKKKNQELLIKVGAIFVVLLFVGTAVTAMVFS